MSKSLKKVVGIAASLIVPYASPIIASAIGLSGAIGGVLGSAVTGAALGGVSSAALGGDWKKGALFGGIGGGIGGYMNPAGGSELFGISGNDALNRFGAASAGGAANGGATAGLSTGGNVAGAAPGATAATPATPTVQGIPEGMQMAIDTSTTPPPTFGQRAMAAIKAAPGELASKVTDPKFLADLTLRAGQMAVGPLLAGSMADMTPAEQQLLAAQAEDMQIMRMQNQDLYNLKMAQAQKFLNEAEQLDPITLGKASARQEQVRSGLATIEGLRGIRDESKRQAEARRYALQASKGIGTAYEQGQARGLTARAEARQAGLNALPAPTSLTSYSQLADAYGDQYRRKAEAERDIGKFFGGLFDDKSTGSNAPTVNYNIGYPV
jgi:hypothetical protein